MLPKPSTPASAAGCDIFMIQCRHKVTAAHVTGHLVKGEAPVEQRLEVVAVQLNGLAVLLNGCSKVALLAKGIPSRMVLVGCAHRCGAAAAQALARVQPQAGLNQAATAAVGNNDMPWALVLHVLSRLWFVSTRKCTCQACDSTSSKGNMQADKEAVAV